MIMGHELTFISNWTTIQRLPGFCGGDEAAFKWVVQSSGAATTTFDI